MINSNKFQSELNSLNFLSLFQSIYDGKSTVAVRVIEGSTDAQLHGAISQILCDDSDEYAVLLKSHGLLVWDRTWQVANARLGSDWHRFSSKFTV